MYASVCDFVHIALLLPFVLGFCPSILFVCLFVLFFYFKKFFFLIIIFYFNNYFILFYFILFHFILSSSFFLSFSPFYSELCGGQALGAPARHQGCATEVGEPSSGHWSTRDLPAPRNIKW